MRMLVPSRKPTAAISSQPFVSDSLEFRLVGHAHTTGANQSASNSLAMVSIRLVNREQSDLLGRLIWGLTVPGHRDLIRRCSLVLRSGVTCNRCHLQRGCALMKPDSRDNAPVIFGRVCTDMLHFCYNGIVMSRSGQRELHVTSKH